jgi:ATP-dependent Clp protease ATP-binding subunit ClpA
MLMGDGVVGDGESPTSGLLGPDETRLSTWPPFSETGRVVMFDAAAYSRAQGHEQIDLEALLVAAVQSMESAVCRAIAVSGLSAVNLAASIRVDARAHAYREGTQPFSRDAKTVIQSAQLVAKRRKASYIGAADLLVAALEVTNEWPVSSLLDRGVTVAVVYAEAGKLPRELSELPEVR